MISLWNSGISWFTNNVYDKVFSLNDKLTKKAKNYALKKFVASDYLRDVSAVLPLTLITILTKFVFNFLITSRLTTNNYFIDFGTSIIVNVSFTLLSPFFYNLITYILHNEVNEFVKNVIDNLHTTGWVYFEYWKTRILGISGISIIIILFFVEINSRWIQEFIFHTMICSIIVDNILYLKLKRSECEATPNINITILPQKVEILESYYPNLEREDVSGINNRSNQIIQTNTIQQDKPNLKVEILDNYSPEQESNKTIELTLSKRRIAKKKMR